MRNNGSSFLRVLSYLQQAQKKTRTVAGFFCVMKAYTFFLFANPNPTRPRPIRAIVAGVGTCPWSS